LPVPAAAALKKADLSILLTDNSAIQRLNFSWRGKNKPTDVLSFPQFEKNELKKLAKLKKIPSWEMGDIVISLEKAKSQAKEHRISLKEELEILLVHGILHLLGFDHEISAKEEKKMQKLEMQLLKGEGLIRLS
jgi:probable rRNA maturation factor